MITLTPAAAEQIRRSATESGAEPPVLRVAARLVDDGSIDYGMGFDQLRPGDTTVELEGIVVLVAPPSRELLEGTHIDFVEIEPGDFRFVFAPAGEPGAP